MFLSSAPSAKYQETNRSWTYMARLVSAFVLSRLDYCNAILAALTLTLAPLQRVQNATARLVLDFKPWDHLTSTYHQLHWLPGRKNWIQATPAHPPGSDREVAGLSRVAPDNDQVAWFNKRHDRQTESQRRHVYSSDKGWGSAKNVFCRCSTSIEIESSTHWDPLYFEHWTIQAASEDVSVRVGIRRLLTFLELQSILYAYFNL